MPTDPREDLLVRADSYLSLLRHRYRGAGWPADMVAEIDALIGELRRPRVAALDAASPFAGMWIAPDGHGTLTIWRDDDGKPIGLLRAGEVNRSIWAALAAVIPEREADQ